MASRSSMSRLPQPLRRGLHRIAGRLWYPRFSVIYGSEYGIDLPGVPMDGRRGEKVLAALFAEGLVGQQQIHRPPKASLGAIHRVHDPDYIRRLTDPGVMESIMGIDVGARLTEELIEHQRYMTGGSVLATRLAWGRRQLVVNLGGGMHHARRARGGGFCIFNDIAVSIAALRQRSAGRRILVVDLDVHDGDGTRSLFADDPLVYTLSIHNEHWGDIDAVASSSIALGGAVGDRDYLAAVRRHVTAAVDEHRPELVFYVAGVDPAHDDELGNWAITETGMFERDTLVLGLLRARGVRSVVWLMAGGYGHEAWRYTARGLSGVITGRRIEPPTTEEITLLRYRVASRLIDPRLLTEDLGDPFVLDERDLFGGLDPSDRPKRWLGYYTRHGLEVGLEQYGILERLRKLGFAPELEFELGRPEGDTLRVYGAPGRRERLVELRVRRDRAVVPGHELLSIEWLLMQNPRARWVGKRRPLPGQAHPGLGMSEDVLALLMVSCERIGLDGIVVVPSHFHVAARWRQRLRFLDPEVEGRFRAIRRLLEGRSVAYCTRALAAGRVVDAHGVPVRYEPSVMLYPLHPELRRRTEGPDYEKRAEEVARDLQLSLVGDERDVSPVD